MFNMGGPIKQGIMHGIREPYRGGGAALVGNPVYPRTGGREHHNLWLKAGQGVGRTLPHIRRAGRTFKDWASRTFGSTGPVTGKTTTQQVGPWTKGPFAHTEKIVGDTKQVWTPKGWLARDPLYKIGSKIAENNGLLGKALRWAWDTARTPTGVIGGLYYANGRWFNKKGEEVEAPTGIEKPGGYPKGKGTGTDTTTNAAEFANAQREKRLNRYLQLMGYDQSKKTAIADALIDASKIVSDRGTLDRKNITGELINPIIQATSKRLDKPQQIREAVGLMMTKGEIEKDLEDPQVKKLRALQIEKGEKELGENFETDMRNLLLSRKDKVNKDTLKRYARLTADKYGEPFTEVTEETDLSTLDNGIYMSDDKIIRVTDGVPKRIV